MGTAGSRMLKLRTIGIRDYSVLEGEQRIGRIRFADERMPGVWLWNITDRWTPHIEPAQEAGTIAAV
jgi:hypothetical protein